MNQIGSAAVDTFQGFDPLGKLQDAIDQIAEGIARAMQAQA